MTQEQLQDIAQSASDFVSASLSLQLATVNQAGEPLASYAPFYRDQSGNFYILVSSLSGHTANLNNGQANILIIEDEHQCQQIYARTRLNFSCDVRSVPRQADHYDALIQSLHQRHGEIISTISNLADFQLFQLTPRQGLFIRGFGQAYHISPELSEVEPVMPG